MRRRNRARDWQILQRYQRELGILLDWLCCLYVMDLSLRDLQEALYFLKQHLPQAQQQRCITHKVRGLARTLSYAQVPALTADGQALRPEEGKRQRRHEIKSQAYEIYAAETYELAQQRLATFIETWQSVEPKAVQVFQRDLDLTFTLLQFDRERHRHIRTTNHIERLFREFRTKFDEIGAFPHETSCLTVFFLVIQRDHAKHDRSAMAKNS